MERRSVVAIAFGSALVGGVVGALAVGITASRRTQPAASAPSAGATVTDPAVTVRLSSIERRLRALELRRELARVAPVGSASPGGSGPGTGAGVDSPTLIDDPVFEAAVRDVVERVEEDRAGERQAEREQRRRAEVQRWTDRLDERLRLNATQKAKLTEIALDYWRGVRVLWEGDGGTRPSREVRLNQVREARDRADAAIRQTLDPRQAGQYEQLEDDLKLGARRFGRAGTD